jgi:hypothetical protein
MRLIKTHFLCTGVVSLKLAQPLTERKNVKLRSFVGQSSINLKTSDDVGIFSFVCSPLSDKDHSFLTYDMTGKDNNNLHSP